MYSIVLEFFWESLHVSFNNLLLLLLSHFSHVRLCATPWTAAHRLPRSWDSPGKNTGVGCHFLLQCMKVKSESEVAQSCPTLSDPMDRSLLCYAKSLQSCPTLCDTIDGSLPGSPVPGILQARTLEWVAISLGFSIHGIFQARVLEWGAIAFSLICRNTEMRCPLSNFRDWVYLKLSCTYAVTQSTSN